MERQVTCSMCQGIKMVKVGFLGFRPCPECAGRGYVVVQAHEETIIPSESTGSAGLTADDPRRALNAEAFREGAAKRASSWIERGNDELARQIIEEAEEYIDRTYGTDV